MFGNSLLLLTGSKWRDMRATLSPAFTGSKMRQMFDLVSDCGAEMAQTFLKRAAATSGVDCEMKDVFGRYTNDVISSAAFGYKVNSFENENNEFYESGKKFQQVGSPIQTIKLAMILLLPKIASLLKISLIDSKVSTFFRSLVMDTIDHRFKQGIFRPDMINILMNVKKGNTEANNTMNTGTEEREGFATVQESSIGSKSVKRVWTDDELVAQCLLFFLAGFDTSSTLLSFLAYELCTHPDIQQRLFEEIQETNRSIDGKRLTYDALQKMKFMDQVISETLRLWPPAPATDRICVKDYDYDDGQCKFKIEKGVVLTIPIVALHHDEKYFANPMKFDPDRFSDENKDNILPGTYLPFGVGPRNCIVW